MFYNMHFYQKNLEVTIILYYFAAVKVNEFVFKIIIYLKKEK